MLFSNTDAARVIRGHHRLSPRNRIVFSACTLITAVIAVLFTARPDIAAPDSIATLHPVVSAAADAIPSFTESWVTPPGHTEMAHSSAICALPSGDLLAVWYGGSREGAPDVS